MAKIEVRCDLCGISFRKEKGQLREHNFCCFAHFRRWNSQRMAAYNRSANPMNKPGSTMSSRLKKHAMLAGTGEGKAYKKLLGRHAHRVIAEQTLGRPLRSGEVVHHIDGNKLNNHPDNLMVLPSQKEHARLHAKGGDADDSNKG